MLTTCMSFPMVVLMERTLHINLKCLCVSKVLENLSIFICYCYSHDTFSFFYCIFLVNLLFVTPSKAAVAALTVTDYEIPTLNFKRMSIKEKELLRALLGQFCKLEVVIVNHFLIFQSMDSALNLLSQHLME